MQQDSENKQRVALITGSSRGIGTGIAQRLARDGFFLALNYSGEHSAQAADELAKQLKEEYAVETATFRADVSDFDAASKLVEQVQEHFGRIDVLVNNAGINRDGLLARMKEDDFDSVISVNLKGAFNCMRHVTPIMMKQRYGRIVSISSIVGVEGNAGQANYAASKAGIIGLTKSVAKELARRNITANAVAPGFIDTDMTRNMSDKARDAALERIAATRMGTTADVAAAVAFFASEESGYVTGQVLGVDGGLAL